MSLRRTEAARHPRDELAILAVLEAAMFERDEVLQDLHSRLVSAGINPLDPKVQAICEVVNAFYAEKTRDVLEKMQAVLSKIDTSGG
jgi:hypothetical protein